MYACKSTYGAKYVCQKCVCKSSCANVRKQMYVGYKVRMSKVRTQMFVLESSYVNVRTQVFLRKKNLCKSTYGYKIRTAKVRMQNSCANVHTLAKVRKVSSNLA